MVVAVTNCFDSPGDYLMFQTVIRDQSQKVAGRVDGVLATADVRGPIYNLVYMGFCVANDGSSYKKYIQYP